MKKLIAAMLIMTSIQPSQFLFCGETVDPALSPQALPAVPANATQKSDSLLPLDSTAQAAQRVENGFVGGAVSAISPTASTVSAQTSNAMSVAINAASTSSPTAPSQAARDRDPRIGFVMESLRAQLPPGTDVGFTTDAGSAFSEMKFFIQKPGLFHITFNASIIGGRLSVQPDSIQASYSVPAPYPVMGSSPLAGSARVASVSTATTLIAKKYTETRPTVLPPALIRTDPAMATAFFVAMKTIDPRTGVSDESAIILLTKVEVKSVLGRSVIFSLGGMERYEMVTAVRTGTYGGKTNYGFVSVKKTLKIT